MTASRSSSKSGKSRWQWLSTSIKGLPSGGDPFARRRAGCAGSRGGGLPGRLPVAREKRRRRRQRRTGFEPAGLAKRCEAPFVGGDAELVEQLLGRCRH